MNIRRMLFALIVLALTSPVFAAGGEKGDVEIGLYAGYGMPDDYGEGPAKLNPDDDLLYGLRLGYFFSPHWSLELSGQQFSSKTQFDPALSTPDVDFDINSYRLNLLYNFRPEHKLRPFLTLGAGLEQTDVGSVLDESDAGYNVGGGLRWFLTNSFGLRLDGRYVSTDVGGALDDRQQNVETTLGVLWAFGGGAPGDADGDGVSDRRDKCPDTPRGAVVDKRGCPVDSDGDGVADGLDRCPDTPSGVPVDGTGCPRDSDGDGVHDGIDKCPNTPRGARVDDQGCPKDADKDGVADGIDKCPNTPRGAAVDATGCPKDSDGDGVFDGLDKCPNTPRGAEVDATGCPKDSDGDGVFDGLDKCPGTPTGTKVDAKGCKVLFEAQRRTLVLEGVNFEFNSAKLTPKAEGVLDRVAMSLKEWTDIRVEVAGHTDSRGDDQYNLGLSTRRAMAVLNYLAAKGVDPARMTARGYGEARPLVQERTAEDEKKNRRVELNKLN
jgi:outer membrane beta-barrel protein